MTFSRVMLPWQKLAAWSKRASRIPPSAFSAIISRASSSYVYPSRSATIFRWLTVLETVIRSKSYIWQRDRIVGSSLFFSVVARMKMTYEGGSSSVFRKALKACVESMWTSSMMKTLYLPICGGMRVCSISCLIFSTELLEAASSSKILYERPSANALQLSHSPQASPSAVGCSQLMVLAKIRAHVVLPTPRGPQKRKAWASLPLAMAFFSVVVSASCPTTDEKDIGRYFLAETWYSIKMILWRG